MISYARSWSSLRNQLSVTSPKAGHFYDFHSAQCHSFTTVPLNRQLGNTCNNYHTTEDTHVPIRPCWQKYHVPNESKDLLRCKPTKLTQINSSFQLPQTFVKRHWFQACQVFPSPDESNCSSGTCWMLIHPSFYFFLRNQCLWGLRPLDPSVDFVLRALLLREAPPNLASPLFGHCPNSDYTHPPALWGTSFPGRFEQICRITVLMVHKCTKHPGKP